MTNAGTDRDDILEVMVVGNTAMHHMFFGIPSQHLAKSPYAPVVRTSLTVNATHAGIDIYPFGKVSSLPNIAGFVGADAVADLLASGLHKDRDIGMMIDIGTNTEIVAGNRDRLISCSCASGPAFEGAHIRFGMRASTGAIERIWIDPATKDVLVRTVEDKPPKGICGSGIVDAVSEMLKTDMIDPSGRLDLKSGARGIRRNSEGVPEFVLVHAKDTAMGEDITVTQHDIQEIQLAKAAIFTGVSTLMRRLRVRCYRPQAGLRRGRVRDLCGRRECHQHRHVPRCAGGKHQVHRERCWLGRADDAEVGRCEGPGGEAVEGGRVRRARGGEGFPARVRQGDVPPAQGAREVPEPWKGRERLTTGGTERPP